MEFLTGDAAKNARTEIVRRGLLKCSLCNSKAMYVFAPVPGELRVLGVIADPF